MKFVTCIRISAPVLLVAAALAGCGWISGDGRDGAVASRDLPIGRMKVSIMPEYDDPGVLVIYEGRFEEAASYPIRTSFLVAKGSVISDACSLSHEGQHFCQLYRTVNRGDFDEVSTQLPYPNFYLSFHTPRLDTARERKEFDVRIRATHRVRTMEVDVQQPLRSGAFSVTAPERAMQAAPGGVSVIKGFNHLVYRLEDVAAGAETRFRIGYAKSDPNPSVDIKVAPMRDATGQTTSYDAQRNVKPYLYAAFAAGALGLVLLVAWHLRAGRVRRGKRL